MTNFRVLRLFATALILLAACAAAIAQPTSITVIRCGRLINPVDGSVTSNAIVIVRGERVEQVGAGIAIPEGAKVIDLSRYTVLPGLIDRHTHVMLQPEDEQGPP